MHQAGIDVFNKRDEKKSRVYSFEQKNIQLDKDFEKNSGRINKRGNFFNPSLPPIKNLQSGG